MAPPLDRDWKPRPSNSFFSRLRLPRRTRRRTLSIWALLCVAIYYLFFRSSTDNYNWEVPSVPKFLDYHTGGRPIPIRFPKLYKSLSTIHAGRRLNNNVVFAAANLTAASKMAGLACEMAMYRRSSVHMVLMGFDTLEIDEFRRLNGLPLSPTASECHINFHDARAFDAELLPIERRKIAIKSVFRHLGTMMRPQAVMIDSEREEEWFTEIAQEKAGQLGLTLIKLPNYALEDLRWITRLDAMSLNAWHIPTFEIIIHADQHTGNLERLLRSIASANYPSKTHRPTRVTVVLDPSVPVHPFTRDFLHTYNFPARSRVTVQRSVHAHLDPLSRAAEFVSSFYGISAHHSVLFLDPNVELSQWYAHFILYSTFEYRYSLYHRSESQNLFGISLEPPSTYPSGKPFDSSILPNEPTFFKHPAPNSRAGLYFSEHWSEFHSYLSSRITPEFSDITFASRSAPRKDSLPKPRPLKLSKSVQTSWTGYFIELARARGYVMLYPSLPEPLVVSHHEVPGSGAKAKARPHAEQRLMSQPLPEGLPGEDLPEWNKIPTVDLWGDVKRDLEKDGLEWRNWISTCPEDTFTSYFEVDDIFCAQVEEEDEELGEEQEKTKGVKKTKTEDNGDDEDEDEDEA